MWTLPIADDDRVVSQWWQTACALATVVTIAIGVFYWHWPPRYLVLLYWMENLIIGAIQLLKFLFCPSLSHRSWGGWLLRLFFVTFFLFHYGGFCSVHGLFLLMLSGSQNARIMSDVSVALGRFVFLDLLRMVTSRIWDLIPPSGVWSLAGMLAGHLVGMFRERAKWQHMGFQKLMQEPYKHIVVVHVAIIIGMFFAMILKNPLPVLGLIVIGKFVIDVREIWRSQPST